LDVVFILGAILALLILWSWLLVRAGTKEKVKAGSDGSLVETSNQVPEEQGSAGSKVKASSDGSVVGTENQVSEDQGSADPETISSDT
jgi:hypothetical protein